jgi:hypothetical protein
MYLKLVKEHKRIPHPGGYKYEPVYDWYKVTEPDHISKYFTIGKCDKGYVLYHSETLQAVCIGKKGDMRELAKEMKYYEYDGFTTWKRNGSTIRSLQKLVESKG